MRQESFKTFDNSRIRLYFWDDVEEPAGIVQIAHGMAEHALRYEDFARFLNRQNLIAAADDHRAFGRSAALEDNGVYDGDIFADTLRDLLDIKSYLQQKWPGLPCFFLGHSYGSFLGQAFIQEAGQTMQAAVLMGSDLKDRAVYGLAAKMLSPFISLLGYERPARLLDRLIFGGYDRLFSEGEGAWLSRDREEVEHYLQDPYCGQVASLGFYRSFLNFPRLYQEEKLRQIPENLPLLLTAGCDDPVNGGKGKAAGMQALYDFYHKLGLKNLSLKLYPGARHEILHEINRQEVYRDLADFFGGVIYAQ